MLWNAVKPICVVLSLCLTPLLSYGETHADTPSKTESVKSDKVKSESYLSYGETLSQILIQYKNKPITVVLSSGQELSGTVESINDSLVVIKSLKGREFYDAVVRHSMIDALIVRRPEKQ
ncbi:hypothetical protein KCM76_02785 [Zooshikella marina]|uniref:MSHA biogenesis protein MshK n=1 Tax=Zooshikella ganghwensis TaxID=202772 RepID=A0A4P9VPE2_9GAMM|nr:hypothetical protein [Zooshikella ganghwensis]MBU2704887.1 hypothetical protein [Zooshikella ganghwensis]RDH45323.1 hypothetical protein B9G39_18750 [Zooshikella ganghwensis]